MCDRHKCCGCIPIRNGVWILSVLGVIGSIGCIAQGLIVLTSGITVNDIVSPWAPEETRESAKIILTIARGEAGLKLGFGLLHLLLSGLLIQGMTRYKAGYLGIWVKVNLVLIVLGLIAAIALLSKTLVVLDKGSGIDVGVIAFVVMVVIFAWDGYCTWIVHKYATIMLEE